MQKQEYTCSIAEWEAIVQVIDLSMANMKAWIQKKGPENGRGVFYLVLSGLSTRVKKKLLDCQGKAVMAAKLKVDYIEAYFISEAMRMNYLMLDQHGAFPRAAVDRFYRCCHEFITNYNFQTSQDDENRRQLEGPAAGAGRIEG